jgi:hypothetical protein
MTNRSEGRQEIPHVLTSALVPAVTGLRCGPRLHWGCGSGSGHARGWPFIYACDAIWRLDKQTRDELLMHARSQRTLMSFLKFYHLTEPTHRIHDHTDGNFDLAIQN